MKNKKELKKQIRNDKKTVKKLATLIRLLGEVKISEEYMSISDTIEKLKYAKELLEEYIIYNKLEVIIPNEAKEKRSYICEDGERTVYCKTEEELKTELARAIKEALEKQK